jgi:hypothetical protein
MQIVIDIPERTYEQLKFLREQGFDGFETIIDKAVANGTPLPKHHGRLIDADAMQKYQIDTFGQRLLVIDTAPTIIDAESEDKE